MPLLCSFYVYMTTQSLDTANDHYRPNDGIALMLVRSLQRIVDKLDRFMDPLPKIFTTIYHFFPSHDCSSQIALEGGPRSLPVFIHQVAQVIPAYFMSLCPQKYIKNYLR